MEKVLVLLIESGFVYCIFWVIAFWPPSMARSSTLNVLQTIYLSTTFRILPSSGKYVVDLTMLFISVRTGKEFVKVLNRLIFCFQSTYPVSVNVLAVTTQSYESSGVLPVVQSVK